VRAKPAPTLEDYEGFDGAHCRVLWRSLTDDWRCPSCGRSKFEVMRWTKRYPPGRRHEPYFGWLAAFHEHHDHSVLFAIPTNPDARFPNTVMCDHCNMADASAKRKLRLPENWSFSPDEIARFIKATPHSGHSLNYNVARAIYEARGLLLEG
jgi:rubredoxin